MKPTPSQRQAIEFITEQGGKGMMFAGYRNLRRGRMKDSGTPVLTMSEQALDPMVSKGIIEKVEGEKNWYRVAPSHQPPTA